MDLSAANIVGFRTAAVVGVSASAARGLLVLVAFCVFGFALQWCSHRQFLKQGRCVSLAGYAEEIKHAHV